MLMECEKMDLSVRFICAHFLWMEYLPVHLGTLGATFRYKDASQLEVSLRWRNVSNRFFPQQLGFEDTFCNVRIWFLRYGFSLGAQ